VSFKKWSNRIEGLNDLPTDDQLDKWGAEGWEFVQAIEMLDGHFVVYLKREIVS